MNRRNVLFGLLASLLGGLFVGWRKYGKASPKAVSLAHNGIISKDRTPHLIGCKVYVNGKRIEHAISVNTTKGFVLAWNQKPTADPTSWIKSRIYGYIEIDPSDCFIARPRLANDEPGSMHGQEPHNYGGKLWWHSEGRVQA